MIPYFILDEELAERQAEFFSNTYQNFAIFYPKRYKSHVLCSMLGHDWFSIDGYNENNEVSEILTCCLRCKIETIRKVNLTKENLELIN